MDGIIVYYPIFGNRQDQYLQQIVAVDKDVEGLGHRYIFNMYQNIRFLDPATKTKKSILPCTPLAVLKILEHLNIYNSFLKYGNRLHGRTITVINRSEVVGRPLAALLANDGACVYSVDIENVQQFSRGSGLRKARHEVRDKPGWTLENCLPLSDVVISGVPGDAYKVPLHLLREGACCINFSSQKNFDPEVKELASLYVPAIGSVTIAVLLRNLLVSVIQCMCNIPSSRLINRQRLVRNKEEANAQQLERSQETVAKSEPQQLAQQPANEEPLAEEITSRLKALPLKQQSTTSPDLPGTPVGMERTDTTS